MWARPRVCSRSPITRRRSPGEPGHGVFFGDAAADGRQPQDNPITDNIEPFAQNGGTINGADRRQRHQLGLLGVGRSAIRRRTFAHVVRQPARATSSCRGASSTPRSRGRSTTRRTRCDSTPATRRSSPGWSTQTHGPVIPPSVPYAPYKSPTVYHMGQDSLKGLFKIDHSPVDLRIATREVHEGRRRNSGQRIDDRSTGRASRRDGRRCRGDTRRLGT